VLLDINQYDIPLNLCGKAHVLKAPGDHVRESVYNEASIFVDLVYVGIDLLSRG
jgi:hypothetical protein